MAKKKDDPSKIAAIVDDNGHLQGQFQGFGAQQDAESHLRYCQRSGVKHLQGATIVTGEKAREAIRKKRL